MKPQLTVDEVSKKMPAPQRGEEVIVPRLSEHLQDMWVRRCKAKVELEALLTDAAAKYVTWAKAPACVVASNRRLEALIEVLQRQFWFGVTEQYDLWPLDSKFYFGIRQGMVIVKIRKPKHAQGPTRNCDQLDPLMEALLLANILNRKSK